MKAFRNVTLLSLSLATLALVAATPAAYASTETVFGTPDPTATTVVSLSPIMGTIDVAQFDPSLGTLNSVEVILSGNGSTDYFVSYSGTGPGTVSSFSTTAHLYVNALSIPTLNLSLSGTDDLSSSPVSLNNGDTYDSGFQPIIGSAVNETVGTTGWIGLGDVTFTLTGMANSGYLGNIPSGGALTLAPTTEGAAGVEVVYTYDAGGVTPEPGTLTLFGTGLLGLAGMLRRKFAR